MFKLRKTRIHQKYASKQELKFGDCLDCSKQFQVPSKHPYWNYTSFPIQLALVLALEFHIHNSMQHPNGALLNWLTTPVTWYAVC